MAATTPAEGESVRCCPDCGHSNLWARASKSPTYRCVYGHEFDAPERREPRASGRTYISDGEFLADVRRVAVEHATDDQPLGVWTYDDYGDYSYSLYTRFGGWTRVLRAAGVGGGDDA